MQNRSQSYPDQSILIEKRESGEAEPLVLCVDLDGTLVAGDILWESILLLFKQQPWTLLFLPVWALRGRAFLKRQIAQRVILDPASLSYCQEVLEFLHEQKDDDRILILATASDRQPAEAVAAHLGIFSDVIASDGTTNLSGHHKRRTLEQRFGQEGFDYMGNSTADLEVWPSAKAAILVNPSAQVQARAERSSTVTKIFPRTHHSALILLKALRIHQWVKNILIFLPLIASHQIFDTQKLFLACFAFISMSFCASSLYILNDLLDLSADRRHPQKKARPFASGDLSISHGLTLIPLLLLIAFMIAIPTLAPHFIGLLLLYAISTIAYSFLLKQLPILDVLCLAGLYTLRIIAGGVAIGVPISSWLLAFSMFLFLSLAFGKRHSELRYRKVNKHQGLDRRGYIGMDKEVLSTMGMISGYMSVLVLALYINSQDVLTLYHNPKFLWLACPLLLYWISRTWLLAHRGRLNDDPLIVALKDPQSYSVAAAVGLITLLAL